jgi:hypothetical protein
MPPDGESEPREAELMGVLLFVPAAVPLRSLNVIACPLVETNTFHRAINHFLDLAGLRTPRSADVECAQTGNRDPAIAAKLHVRPCGRCRGVAQTGACSPSVPPRSSCLTALE